MFDLTVAEGLKPKFSGHETFPLRQLWLPKFAKLIAEQRASNFDQLPSDEECIVRLGVGKNMVSAMRFWSEAAGIVRSDRLELTELGRFIFANETGELKNTENSSESVHSSCSRVEHPAAQWLVHWRLTATPDAFTANWFLFNFSSSSALDRSSLLKALRAFSEERGWKTTESSLKRALEVVLRSYLPRLSAKGRAEDFVEPYLSDLGLLAATGRDSFRFCHGMHPSLPAGVFAFALLEHWGRVARSSSSLDFSRIAYSSGSPGRVFKLDSESLRLRLSRLEDLTDGALAWTEQAGLRQVIRQKDALSDPQAFKRRMLCLAFAE